MAYQPNQPYNDLPPLPPDHGLESVRVLRQCVRASRALAELKGAGQVIPNQSILINAIPLQEAKLSSEIENIVTTQDELYHAAIDVSDRADPAAKEVLRYRTALRYGYEILDKRLLDIDTVVELCRILRDEDVVLRDMEHVVIGDAVSGSIIYTPPQGRSLILSQLRNLLDFLRGHNEPDILIRIAAAHYQFEAIHPFSDGNGRTGRILNILAMLQAGLLEIPVLYLSRYIIQNKQDYYHRLRAVTENQDWEGWLLFMLRAVEDTALWTTNRIRAIASLFDITVERCRKDLPERVYSKELIELIFEQPYCKIAHLVDSGLAKRQTASEYLQELEKIGILVSEKRGRYMIYRNPSLLEVLSAS